MDVRITNSETGCDEYFIVFWSQEPPAEQIDAFKELIDAWFRVGMYGLFGGFMHYLDEIKTDHLQTSWWVDMGSVEYDKAVNALQQLLRSFDEPSPLNVGWVRIECLQIGEGQ